MGFVLLLARIIIGLVFGLAGVTKVRDLKRSRTAMVDFGVPAFLAAPFGVSLPFLEIAIACLVIPASTAHLGAWAALSLLIMFVLGIGINLARGKRPDCHCFGQLHSAPVGPSTLVRNSALACLAGLILSQPSDAGLSFSTALAITYGRHPVASGFGVAVIVAIAAQSWLLFHLFRQNGRLLLRMEALESATGSMPTLAAHAQSGLRIGSPAPPFTLPLARGGSGSLDKLREERKPIVLVFSDANCEPCRALIPDLTRWQREHSGKLTFAVITRGASKEKIASQYEFKHIFVQQDREVATLYHAAGTPSAVLVRADGLVGSGLMSGALAIGDLISAAARAGLPIPHLPPAGLPPRSSAPPVGSLAPALALPDLTGKTVGVADFRGHRTMLLFWNPACGFCNRMLPDLKRWEETRAVNAPRLLVVSTGPAELNQAMGLRSPVLLDQNQGASQLFGANGTPSALIVDGEGKIESELALGADAFFALAASGGTASLEAAKGRAVSARANGN